MAAPDLHIISFAVPYPARYGGAIDVYNRIKALHDEGVRIKLHCFVYGPFSPHNALREISAETHYYPRISWPALLATGTPYIVASRKNPMLLENLNKDNSPILFEGVHTTGYFGELANRKKILRAHNIEHQYYSHLAKDSQRFQYLFFERESLALEKYETSLAKSFDHVFTISKHDLEWYSTHGAQCDFLPAFHGIFKEEILPGKGSYILYQGDLSIESNQKAVLEVLKTNGAEKYSWVIAGRSGERGFEEKLKKFTNLRREQDVSEDKMITLIKDAHIVIVHSRHPSGMKVKIFPALYYGRFIACNENSLTHTGIDAAFHCYHRNEEINEVLEKLWNEEFTEAHRQQRANALTSLPDDKSKAQAIIRYL